MGYGAGGTERTGEIVVKEESVFRNGEWTASTLGEFVSLLIDGGDVAVMYRQIAQMEPDENGRYAETLQVILLPNGHIKRALGVQDMQVHKTLEAMLKGGVMK